MRTINVGIFGLGVVGCGVVDILQRNNDLIKARLGADLKIKTAVVRDLAKKRPCSGGNFVISDDPDAILKDNSIDIIVEVMGGTGLARRVVMSALEAGKPLVTANKALLAEYASEIFTKAYQTKTSIGFEAAVAGGIPVLRSLREGLSGDNITEICGIVNGTSNYILSKMTGEGASFEEVLAEAQKLGYAEADPTFDVEGHDAAQKLALLINLAYGTMVHYPDIYKEGIRHITPMDIAYARQLGYTIKLLAIGKRKQNVVEARVHPTLIANSHQLAAVNGVFNAVFLTGDNADATMSYGRGAGDLPTGSAVVSDIMDLARNLLCGINMKVPPLSVTKENLVSLEVMGIKEITSEYYLRFQTRDTSGVLANITQILGSRNISIQSMFQPSQADHPEDPVQVILITHQARERDILASLNEIAPMDFIMGPTQLIRIERF